MEISNRVKTLGTASVAITAMLAGMALQVAPASAQTVSATTFNRNFTTMSYLTSVTAKGSGGIGAILPDTVSSTRYVEFDAPYLTEAMQKAGLPASDISVVNAHGSDATEFSDAQADITKGDKVLIMDPLDSGVGAKIESYAASHGVKVIDYDRLTLGGDRAYYDSFNNNYVGTLLGNGLVSCIASEHVANPVVLVMHGAVTDNNATLFADGYDSVLQPYFSSGKWKLVGKLQPNEVPAGTWTPSVALTEFQQEYTAHSNINAVLMPNDENGAPIITYLKSKGIKANSFPVTGQDATLTGLGNVLTGYQCGTVYKPIYLEAQAAVALAVYLRAGIDPPAGLVNGSVTDSVEHKSVPSVLLTPEWVTSKNMASTVIADKFVPPAQLCAAPYATAAACKAAGINP
ncbi:MAG TPA: substrate-binding domain-containing protein [Acidimicrobiales bacterium]|nr:substrate-binding domain-containing protein [Acidimicrobiales bacterium]